VVPWCCDFASINAILCHMRGLQMHRFSGAHSSRASIGPPQSSCAHLPLSLVVSEVRCVHEDNVKAHCVKTPQQLAAVCVTEFVVFAASPRVARSFCAFIRVCPRRRRRRIVCARAANITCITPHSKRRPNEEKRSTCQGWGAERTAVCWKQIPRQWAFCFGLEPAASRLKINSLLSS
jgi:hypothetical protein